MGPVGSASSAHKSVWLSAPVPAAPATAREVCYRRRRQHVHHAPACSSASAAGSSSRARQEAPQLRPTPGGSSSKAAAAAGVVAGAAAVPAAPPASTAAASSAGCRIRTATNADWWAIADLHCAAFYPRATPFWFAALRLDRVMALQIGMERAVDCQFQCLVAERSDDAAASSSDDAAASSSDGCGGSGEGGEGWAAASRGSPGAATLQGAALPPGMPAAMAAAQQAAAAEGRVELGPLVGLLVSLFFPPYMRLNYASTYAAGGLRGAVVIDTYGVHLPPKRRHMPNGTIREVPRSGICYLSNLAVAPCTRRSGVGRKLLHEAEAVATSWGCRSVALHVDPSNTAAVQMYRRAGYRHVMNQPEWQRIMEGRDSPLALMMRVLPWEARQAAKQQLHSRGQQQDGMAC